MVSEEFFDVLILTITIYNPNIFFLFLSRAFYVSSLAVKNVLDFCQKNFSVDVMHFQSKLIVCCLMTLKRIEIKGENEQ